MRRPLTLLLCATIVALWSAALLAAPAAAWPRLSAATYAAGSLICHQQSTRSFHLAGAQLPVCARCLGLYLGGALGVLGWMAVAGVGRRPAARAGAWLTPHRVRAALIVLLVPTLLTVASAWSGWWDAGNAIRLALALPLGAYAAALVAAVAAGDLR